MRTIFGLALFLSACGSSGARVAAARNARYPGEFQAVFGAAARALLAQELGLRFADPVRGELRSEWTLVKDLRWDASVGTTDGLGMEERTRQGRRPVAGRLNNAITAGALLQKHLVSGRESTRPPGVEGSRAAALVVQLRVRIVEGGPPWRVVIEGEGAAYFPGMGRVIPFAAPPEWVAERVDAVYVALYDSLTRRRAPGGRGGRAPRRGCRRRPRRSR